MMFDANWCEQGEVREYRTTRPIYWPIGRKGSPHLEKIPEGTEFESSVPKCIPSQLFDRHDPAFLPSACVHDWLLETGYDADFADSQWLAAARKMKAPKFKAKFARFMMLLRRYRQS